MSRLSGTPVRIAAFWEVIVGIDPFGKLFKTKPRRDKFRSAIGAPAQYKSLVIDGERFWRYTAQWAQNLFGRLEFTASYSLRFAEKSI